MRNSMIKLLRVEHSFKFGTVEEAKTEAHTVAQMLSRYVDRHKMSCKALICVSENDIRCSIPAKAFTGKKGRPAKVFIDKHRLGKEASKVKPHLHILIASDEADKVARKVVSNINNRHRKNNPKAIKQVVSRRYPVKEGVQKYIAYVMHQGIAKRFVEMDYKKLLKDFSFESEYEAYKDNLY